MGRLVMMLCLAGCGFAPAYPGEPDCGSRHALHAVRGESCDGSIRVACDCEDRETLECVGGTWVWAHDICPGGLSVRA